MYLMVNGREVDIPTDAADAVETNVIRQAQGIPQDRPLLLQRPDGGNEIINPGEKRKFHPGSHIRECPLHIRGFENQ